MMWEGVVRGSSIVNSLGSSYGCGVRVMKLCCLGLGIKFEVKIYIYISRGVTMVDSHRVDG